ncbi:MAG TPA: hypothetical protein O0X91_04470, partial [Methanocorpusculum sp.]|nr:hypothetical protein [Methanocorpusculum sp.]
GDIKYCFSNPFVKKKFNELIIKSDSDIQEIKLLLTSDSHFGHKLESLERIEYSSAEAVTLSRLRQKFRT